MTEVSRAMNKQVDAGFTGRMKFFDFASADHPRFDEAHAMFWRYFPLEDGSPYLTTGEFRKLLDDNTDPAYQSQFGPVRTMWTCIADPATDRIIGGTTYVGMVLPPDLRQHAGIDAIYLGATLFVEDSYRGRGLALALVGRREKAICQFAADCGAGGGNPDQIRLLAINEQNDPRKMTLSEIEQDIRISGIHTCDRLISTRQVSGWRTIDSRFDYIEVGDGVRPGNTHTTLGVRGTGRMQQPDTIPAEVLCYFLRTYGSVRKLGQNPDHDPVMRQQLAAATVLGTLRPVDDSAELEELKVKIDRIRMTTGSAAAMASLFFQGTSPDQTEPRPHFSQPVKAGLT